MKSIFTVVLASFAVVHSWGQVALAPATTAISPSAVFVPGSPALSAPANANAVVTNATLLALSDSLLALQTNLQQTLPNLILFNDNFDFMSLGDNGTAATPASNPPGNFSVNFATNFAVNAGVNRPCQLAGPCLIPSRTERRLRPPGCRRVLPLFQ